MQPSWRQRIFHADLLQRLQRCVGLKWHTTGDRLVQDDPQRLHVGRRPDLINFGPFGFGRVVTPEAWLSTWSASSSRAAIPQNGPRVDIPSLVISYTADHCVFPSDAHAILQSLGTADKTRREIKAEHYGHPIPGSREWGRPQAVEHLVEWARFHGS